MHTPRARIRSAILGTLATASVALARSGDDIAYPDAPRRPVVDTYHGETFADHYRWMENMGSAETVEWVEAQDALFLDYVSGSPLHDRLQRRITDIADFDRLSPPVKAGGRYFYSVSEPGNATPTLLVLDAPDAEPRVAMDFRDLFPDERDVLNGWGVSPDGRHLAFGVSPGATGWRTIRIFDLQERTLLADSLVGLGDFNSVQWTGDGRGIFYRRYDLPADPTSPDFTLDNPRVCFHRVGTDQSEDAIVMAFPDRPERFVLGAILTPDDRFLIGSTRDKPGAITRTWVRDLTDPEVGFVALFDTDLSFTYLHNTDSTLLFTTDVGAPKGRVVEIDPRHPEPSAWREVVPEDDDRLAAAGVYGDQIIATYSRDARQELRAFALDGTFIRTIELPGIGSVLLSGRPGDADVFFSYGNLFTPNNVYRLNLETGETTPFADRELHFDPNDYVMKQVFYSSADGTRVPMFIAHRKGLKLDGSAPAWMYGYGHAGWVAFPWFQAHLVAWLDLGGVYALPGIRGGGEYGAEWQAAGVKRNKPHAIADFIAAAEWLIENRYTSPKGMVANGGSASGILPAVAVVQRPDLFGAAVVDFPFLDMYRYHLNAYGFTSGYGSPEDPEDFAVLKTYSPYQNLVDGTCYPPTLVTVAERDQSTAPHHGYKFVAAMQAAQSCDKPVLMQMIWGAGHYQYGTTPEASRANLTNQIAFLIRALDLDMSTLEH